MLNKNEMDNLKRLLNFFKEDKQCSPLVVLPIRKQKSKIISQLCNEFFLRYRILIVYTSIDLINNDIKLISKSIDEYKHIGVFSYPLKREELFKEITLTDINSIINKSRQKRIDKIDLVIITETESVSECDKINYYRLFRYLEEINPRIRKIGFTEDNQIIGSGFFAPVVSF